MEVRAEIVRLDLAETFVISRESQDWADVVHVTIRHDGAVGRGEAAPIERYEETAESALAFVEEHPGDGRADQEGEGTPPRHPPAADARSARRRA